MKAHIGVDTHSGLVHSVTATAANEADINQTKYLLHGEETIVFADAGYTEAQKCEEIVAKAPLKEAVQAFEHAKAQVRALVKHPFQIVKRRFGYDKVRYRGLRKNLAKLEILFTLANLVLAKQELMSTTRP